MDLGWRWDQGWTPEVTVHKYKNLLELIQWVFTGACRNNSKWSNTDAHIWPRAELCCPGASGLGHWWRSGCLFHSCWPECFWWVKIRESSKCYSNLNHSKLFRSYLPLLLLQVLLQLLRPLQLQLQLLKIIIKNFVYIALFKFLCRTHQFLSLGLSTWNSGRNEPVKEGSQ